jgi:hypothetical protein
LRDSTKVETFTDMQQPLNKSNCSEILINWKPKESTPFYFED